MARPFTERIAAPGALSLLCCAVAVGGVASEPAAVAPEEARAHLGETVVVEARLGAGVAREGRAEFQAGPLRVVVASSVLGAPAEEIVARLGGRYVRARGRLDDLGGDLELLVSSPSDVEPSDGEPHEEQAPGSMAEPERSPPPRTADRLGSGCADARRAWRGLVAASPLGSLEECLASKRFGCAPEILAARRWIDGLAEVSAQGREACAPGPR